MGGTMSKMGEYAKVGALVGLPAIVFGLIARNEAEGKKLQEQLAREHIVLSVPGDAWSSSADHAIALKQALEKQGYSVEGMDIRLAVDTDATEMNLDNTVQIKVFEDGWDKGFSKPWHGKGMIDLNVNGKSHSRSFEAEGRSDKDDALGTVFHELKGAEAAIIAELG